MHCPVPLSPTLECDWVILLFNKYFLHVYDVPDTFLGAGEISGNTTDKIPGLGHWHSSGEGRQLRDKQRRSSPIVKPATRARLSVWACWVWRGEGCLKGGGHTSGDLNDEKEPDRWRRRGSQFQEKVMASAKALRQEGNKRKLVLPNWTEYREDEVDDEAG